MEELIGAGNKGLELAARRFDPQRGFKFIAYAVWFIRASILALLANSLSEKNLSDLTKEEKRELVSRMSNEREKEMLTRWFGLVDSPESLEEIGQSMNLTTERVKQLKERAIARLVENGKKITWNVSNAHAYRKIITNPKGTRLSQSNNFTISITKQRSNCQ